MRELKPQTIVDSGVALLTVPAILTNIAGPPEQANLAGGEVLQWTAAPPTGGHGVLAIGVISYANNVLVTCHTDKCVFPAQSVDHLPG